MSQWGPRHAQIAALLEQGNADAARAQAQRLAHGSPRDGWAAHLLARACLAQGHIAQAHHFAARAAELIPGHPGLLVEFAQLCQAMRKNDQAMTALREATNIDPEFVPAFVGLAAALSESRQFEEAERRCREWLTRHPADAGAQSLLAGVLLNTARGHEAATLVRALSDANPQSPPLASGAALLSNYDEQASPDNVWLAHRRYGDIMGASRASHTTLAQTRTTPVAPQAAKRALRVGLVSPDLRQHSVAAFVEPLLKSHDRATMQFIVYQTNIIADDVTARLRTLASMWRVMDRVNDAQLAEVIRADGLDVCVELSGHTQANSLAAMHLRPAPVMVTWLGYPNTTGLTTIDARLVDSHTDPPGLADARASERLIRLDPCFLCYASPRDAPEPGPIPSVTRGAITFGSFNAAQKLNPRVIALWARVLGAVPGSRLLLKAVNFEDAGLRQRVLDMFAAGGVDATRVELRGPVAETRGHLDAYGEVDIALDPVPYAGTTTTCEAMWMGVPVVTLAGNMHAGRVGVSLLHAVGLDDLIARDQDDYVRLASHLAADAGRRADLRSSLRRRMREGVLCDGAGFAARFEGALRGLVQWPK